MCVWANELFVKDDTNFDLMVRHSVIILAVMCVTLNFDNHDIISYIHLFLFRKPFLVRGQPYVKKEKILRPQTFFLG